MARYRQIDTRIWNDRKFMALSNEAKLAFLFILTHPSMTMLGAMRGTIDGLASELGCHSACHTLWQGDAKADAETKPSGRGDFRAAINELSACDLIEYDDNACFICAPNFLKYNPPQSINVVKAYAKALCMIPECGGRDTLIKRVMALSETFPVTFRDAIPDAIRLAMPYGKAMIRPIQEQEQEQEDIKEINKEMGDTPNPSPPQIEEVTTEKMPSSRKPPVDTAWIMDMWNTRADDTFRRCSVWSAKRKAAAAARVKEYPGKIIWKGAIDAINASAFCHGGTDGRTWAASIDWLLKPDTITKLTEGAYADKDRKTALTPAQRANAEMTGQRTWESEMSPAGHLYAPFWRHPDDPIPTDEAKARAGEWESIKATMAEDMEPGDFEVFDRDGLVCEAVSDGRLWLVVAQRIDRAVIFRFTGGPRVREVAGRELHVAVDEGLDEVVVY